MYVYIEHFYFTKHGSIIYMKKRKRLDCVLVCRTFIRVCTYKFLCNCNAFLSIESLCWIVSNTCNNNETKNQRLGGGTEIARPGIARPDKSAPYRKGGHGETCFSVRVDAHYKFMIDSGSII